MSNEKINKSRRSFLKNSSFISAGTLINIQPANAVTDVVDKIGTKKVGEVSTWHNCWAHCLSSCLLKAYVKDGKIVRMETDDRGDDAFGSHQVRACLRGRSLHKRAYAEDRLRYPMKRVGERGEGKFVRISWEEALDEVHKRLSTIIKDYGNESIFYRIGYGLPDGAYHFVERFLNSIGGFLSAYGSYSYHQISSAATLTYGSKYAFLGSSSTESQHSDLVLHFGNNHANTRMSGGNDTYSMQWALRESNAKMIVVDPRYTDTALGKEEQWIPIRPGTDAAFIEALSYVLITEGFTNDEFLKEYCYGYTAEEGNPEKNVPALDYNRSYKAYILGEGDDQVAKTPTYAAKITGIPEKDIVKLARELGQAKAPFITQGWGPQRSANGEQTARAIFMLPILLGQLGLPGTNNGGTDLQWKSVNIKQMPTFDNPVKAKVATFEWLEAVTRGVEMSPLKDGLEGVAKLENNVKCLFQYQGNWLINQHSDCNKTDKILRDESLIDFIFVMDNHMTASAKYADILLPDITWLENSRIIQFATHLTMAEAAIEPMYECRHPYDVFTDLADRFGVKQKFTEGRTWEQWWEHLYRETLKEKPHYPSYERLKKEKTIRVPFDPKAHDYTLKEFREDPIRNPLGTSSGKIEIYSHTIQKAIDHLKLDDSEKEMMSALPNYVKTWEGYEDYEMKKKYPLQLIGVKSKGRVHSTYHNVPWLREVISDAISINPVDASERGLKSGDVVHVFNDRGTLEINVNVTPRVIPGVIIMPQGRWYQPDENGVDKGGCINTLTKQHKTALSKGNPQSTNLVEIKRVS